MSHKILMLIGGLFFVLCLQAQNECIIQGTILKNSLRYAPREVDKVYLCGLNEYDQRIVVDSANVEKGNFVFRRILRENEPVLLYFVTGFDNGEIPLFVEPGEVQVSTMDAAYPAGSLVKGTKTIDLYNEYKAIGNRCVKEQKDSLQLLSQNYGKEWLDTQDALERRMRIGAAALVECTAERLQFLLEHNDSPLVPLLMEREFSSMMNIRYLEQSQKALSPDLKQHPYYRSFSNAVRALDLKVGGELPDITIPLIDGGKAFLSDYRGKYVLLDFWASWCAPCIREMPYLKQLYADSQAQRDKFVIVSFSLDNKEKAWKEAVKTQDIAKEGWVHGSDLLGWGSPAARQMGVNAVPKMILIDPEGRAISFSLRGEEMVKRIKQILNGDLYYQNESKDK